MAETLIEWATHVWNPVTGCTKVSPGCKSCYAETVAKRFWKGRKFTDVRCHPERLQQPRGWRRPRRVFVNSMSDLFHEDVPESFIEHVYDSMATFDQHDFLVLTKRPERMRAFMVAQGKRERAAGGRLFPHKNVWLGVSVEDQQRADERIPVLLDTPAAVRFLSCEPMLGALDLDVALRCPKCGYTKADEQVHGDHRLCGGPGSVDWVIVGGSGPGARPCDVAWVRSIVAQCKAAGVPCFVKQLGAKPYAKCHDCTCVGSEVRYGNGRGIDGCKSALALKDRKGGAMEEWPADLRVREFPR